MVMVIRVDSTTQMGAGHVMRTLALAQAWQDQGRQAHFVCAEMGPQLQERIQQGGFSLSRLAAARASRQDALETAAIARQRGARWVVLDGYDFGSSYQRQLKGEGLRVLCLDDYGHAGHYWADVVLNQNSADAGLYRKREASTRLLLGTEYCLLRREFRQRQRPDSRTPALARRILVTMGGTDPDNMTGKVLAGLAGLGGLEVRVAVGPGNPHGGLLEKLCRLAPLRVTLCRNADMPELMSWADLAVSAAGSTAWELAFMGVPALLLVTSENQEWVARVARKEGFARVLPRQVTLESLTEALRRLIPDVQSRREMASKGRRVIDGAGCERVIEELSGWEG